ICTLISWLFSPTFGVQIISLPHFPNTSPINEGKYFLITPLYNTAPHPIQFFPRLRGKVPEGRMEANMGAFRLF
ncbi:hypothetical protein, partial [Glaesserella parasuis]|uniref:hypothetical protein n=1 Tax=Glaesserella parasuis TaxID=738 RepID=UPI001C27AC9E